MEKFEILWELPKCDPDTNWVNAVEKMVLVDWLDEELPQSSIYHLKMQYLQSTMSQYVCIFTAIYTS